MPLGNLRVNLGCLLGTSGVHLGYILDTSRVILGYLSGTSSEGLNVSIQTQGESASRQMCLSFNVIVSSGEVRGQELYPPGMSGVKIIKRSEVNKAERGVTAFIR